MISGRVEIQFNRFADLAAALPREVDAVTAKTTMELEGLIKDRIVEVDAVDTGFMLNSTHGHPDEGTVTTDADYWEFVDGGTINMPARPIVEPPAHTITPQYAGALEQLLTRLGA